MSEQEIELMYQDYLQHYGEVEARNQWVSLQKDYLPALLFQQYAR